MESRDATIYVGNLPWRTTEDDLAGLFQPYGSVVNVRIIQDPATGRSRGFAFVEFGGPEQGVKAVAALNGREFGGRPLLVSFARPKPPRT